MKNKSENRHSFIKIKKRVDDYRPKTLELCKANKGYCIYSLSINLDERIVLE